MTRRTLRRSQASPSRSAYGSLAGFPPPASSHMQAAKDVGWLPGKIGWVRECI